jgi:Zn-dependent membrane protease YugP
MWWGWFDPVYLMFVAPAMILAVWAQWRVKSAYSVASRIAGASGYTGAQAAQVLLQTAGVSQVSIEPVQGFLSDHYDPRDKILRLSPEIYAGRSLAALGIAAHESGHALQDAGHYPLLRLRSGLVPLASIGSSLGWIVIAIGFALASMSFVLIGIAVFSATVLFQLVNLPVEFDASRRARIILAEGGLITAEEDYYVKKVLSAAALTYVAATLSSILTLLYFLYRAGLLGGRRN